MANEELNEEKEPKEVVIPEFYRDLKEDPESKGLWHYVFRTHGDRKPIATPDGLPHKLDFNWKDMFPNMGDRVEVEIGSGKGGFLSEYAPKHPDTVNRKRQGRIPFGICSQAPGYRHHG